MQVALDRDNILSPEELKEIVRRNGEQVVVGFNPNSEKWELLLACEPCVVDDEEDEQEVIYILRGTHWDWSCPLDDVDPETDETIDNSDYRFFHIPVAPTPPKINEEEVEDMI